MTQWFGSTAEVIAKRERDFLLGKTKVKMKSSLENIEAGEYSIKSVSAGDVFEAPRWVAEELVALDLAETDEEPFDVEALKSLSREKMMGPTQLSALPPDFYVRMRRRFKMLSSMVAVGRARKEEVDRLKASCYDLVGIRLSKILQLSGSSSTSPALLEKLTPEESAFHVSARSVSKEWRDALMGGAN